MSSPNTIPKSVSAAIDQGGNAVHRAVGAPTHALRARSPMANADETCIPARPETGGAVDVAVVDEVADFEEGGERREQDGERIHVRAGTSSARPAQQVSGGPECGGRHA